MCETFFDINWQRLNILEGGHRTDKFLKKPEHLNLMIKLSKQLSKNIPFIRVDFYEVEGKVYFSELTFYPAGGFEKFEPNYWDYKLGKILNISYKN